MTDGRAELDFNTFADTYDNVMSPLKPAERLVVNAKIITGQLVLDVACGTGWATMAAARAVGNTGRVIGIDIANKMLDVGRGKAASAGLSNVECRLGDAEELEFDDATFDAVICATAIYLLRDIPKALHEWRRVLKAGGTVAFSSYGKNHLQPVSRLLFERLARYEGQAPPVRQPSGKTSTPYKCRELLKRAGFEDIEITTEQLGDHLQDTTAYWKEISLTFWFLLARLSPADLEKFKTEHLSEVESLRTNQGFWLNIPAIFSVAKKPL
jgi:ubiquinone/menaquinone biosynthesis C-methylase UbiE